MRFMFFGPEVCLGLPSDSASPRTPLPPTTATAAFTAQDLHLVDNAHAGHTKRAGTSLREVPARECRSAAYQAAGVPGGNRQPRRRHREEDAVRMF